MTIQLTNAAADKPRSIKWLWRGYLACGKLHILAGMKGAGKSTVVYNLFAAITAGGKWPDGTNAPIGDVLVWSNEDDFHDTILPRFIAAGGDPSRLYRIGGDKFDPRYDMGRLIEAVKKHPDLKAILIDPLVAVSTRDSHRNAESRHDLQSLVDLAQERGAVVIGIHHLTKGTRGHDPIERITGTLAFGAVPRVVLFVVCDENYQQRRLVRAASNIGPSGDGFAFTIDYSPPPGADADMQNQRVVWGAALKGSGHQLINELDPTTQKGPAARKSDTAEEQAKAFVLAALAAGPVPTKDIEAAAAANGIARGTLHRAYRNLLEVAAEPIPGSRAWQWRLVDPMARRVGFGATTH